MTSSTLDLERLQSWLRPRLPHLPGLDTPLVAERIAGGQSNPTWRLTSLSHPQGRWILRAKPAPTAQLLPSAHAVEREFRVQQALQDSGVPVPTVHLLCEDETVIGAVFYLMDCVEGRVLRDTALPGFEPAERSALLDEAQRVLAQLHRVDWRGCGLADYGQPQGHAQRMVARWSRQLRQSPRPVGTSMQQLMEWLPANLPPLAQRDEAALLHGDYRLENLIFHPQERRVLAVLDWELSTLGHPLVDLAYHCTAWHLPPGLLRGLREPGQPLPAGLPTERDSIERWCRRVGRDDADEVLSQWPWFIACNLFRIAAILHGIAVRVQEGTAAHPQAADIARMADPVADIGWHLARNGELDGFSPEATPRTGGWPAAAALDR